MNDLEARIARLEAALAGHQLPYTDRTCECCGQLYVPACYESCRCGDCCMGCYLPKGAKEWIKGRWCPSHRKEQP